MEKTPLAGAALILLLGVLTLLFFVHNTAADPTGASFTSNITSSASSTAPSGRADPRGTITTLALDAVQQVQQWKAYVGNVTGRFTLDDAQGYTIYDWDFGNTTVTGEVYASRNNSVSWASITCANTTIIGQEESALNMTSSEPTSITNTFNETTHESFYVGATLISNSTCPSTFTYINSTRQNVSETADFQEILLQSGSTLVYATIIEDDLTGYRNTTTYDFQMLVGESDIAAAHTYYFYVELGS
ncbi:hypothetical protein D6783_01790 [Candidatus Woesearchaeota archaeon]|nr:MAG: hypothetical protein D6783_01790 [Candidatus Woesearchaeota archaeon]